MSFEDRLAAALGPEPDYTKIPEESWKVNKGTRLMAEINFRLSETETQKVMQQYQDLMDRFTWDEGSVTEYQNGLRQIFANQPELRDKFSTFLDASTSSEALQAEAMEHLCDIVGIMPQKLDPNRPRFKDNMTFFSDVQKRFESRPEIPDQFLYITHMRWANEESPDVTFAKLAELLKDQPDLLEHLHAIFYGHNKAVPGEDGTDTGVERLGQPGIGGEVPKRAE